MLSAEILMVLGAVTIAGVLFLVQSWRRAAARIASLEAEREKLTAKADRLATDLSKESRARTRQSEELASLRKRIDKSKRRKTKASDQPLGTSQRIRDHEADVARIKLERDAAHSERDALVRSVEALETRLSATERALAEASVPQPEVDLSQIEIDLAAARGELATSRETVSKLESELELARQTGARMRKRMSNQEILYASLRAELDVKKDRLRTQEEQLQRLQALKVAVLD